MRETGISTTQLEARDRYLLADLAASIGVAPAVYALGVIEAYFTLLRDAPAVLPSDPMAGLSARALSRKAKG